MTEMLLEELDEELLDTPFLRKIKRKAYDEGKQEGLQEGEWEGKTKGEIIALREAIMSALSTRFGDLEDQQVNRIQAKLNKISDVAQLHSTLKIVITTHDVESFLSQI